jgi:hypothetical protein
MQTGAAGALLENLLPLVLGYLGKQKQQQGLDSVGLSNYLGQEKARVAAAPR